MFGILLEMAKAAHPQPENVEDHFAWVAEMKKKFPPRPTTMGRKANTAAAGAD
jgi:hypothetical protein